MKMSKSAAMMALAMSCAFTTIDAKPASAITLMELFRGRPNPPVRDFVPPGVENGLPGQKTPEKKAAAPVQRVTGPKYYTYKAEPMRRIAADKLADPVVTGSIASVDLPPMPRDPGSDQRQFLSGVNVSAPADVAKAVEAFYSSHQDLLWIGATGINAQARAALRVLLSAGQVGLDPEDYAVYVPAEVFDGSDMMARQRELAQFEVSLSAAAATFVADSVRGRIDPNRISGYHDFKRKNVDLVSVLKSLSGNADVAAVLNDQSPKNPQFLALKSELQKLKASTDGRPRITIAPGTLLKPGNSNPELANIVAAIGQQGSEALKATHAQTLASYQGSPDYTPDLVSLVEAFQAEKGLKADGIVGNASIRVMTGGDSTQDRINKVLVAMEQTRWMPDDFGSRYVFINQPAFTAYYADDGREQFSMRVVVGSKAHQTYFFNDEIQTVEFNPSWGVPQSIIVNEMLPKLRADPAYLDRMGYDVEIGGRKVSSSSVDWYGSTGGISVRQPPSDDNALGELKILFPNAHAIYMHDTPSKSFFKRDERALSHGCVRLSDPRRMAAAVLGTTVDDVASQIAGGRNRAVPVPVKIPVYVSYFTAWPNKDGVVEYFHDVYDRDMYVNRALDATRKARRAEG